MYSPWKENNANGAQEEINNESFKQSKREKMNGLFNNYL